MANWKKIAAWGVGLVIAFLVIRALMARSQATA